VKSGHPGISNTTGRAIWEVLMLLSAVNVVLSNLFASAVGFSVMSGIDPSRCEVAEAEHSLQASC